VQRDRTLFRAGPMPCNVVNLLIAAMLVLAYAVLAYCWLQRPTVSGTQQVFATMLYSILGLFVLFSIANLRSVDFTQVGIFVFFFLLSLRHNRAVTDAALATYVILAAAASALLEERDRETAAVPTSSDAEERLAGRLILETPRKVRPLRPDRSSPAEVVLGSILLLSISVHASVFTYYYDFNGAGRQKGFGITANMLPVQWTSSRGNSSLGTLSSRILSRLC
jgi:hypothetical protein